MNSIGATGSTFRPGKGEGIFGFGTKDGSLGHSAFIAPKDFYGGRGGVFWQPYSYTWYEAKENPETKWFLEKWPGVPLYPGARGRGMTLVGPSMGNGLPQGAHLALGGGAILLGVLAVGAFGYWLYKRAQ